MFEFGKRPDKQWAWLFAEKTKGDAEEILSREESMTEDLIKNIYINYLKNRIEDHINVIRYLQFAKDEIIL